MNATSFGRLAIIIPAYKSRYLGEALQSIADQSNQDFQLYVMDDCSPEAVEGVVKEFASRLKIKYHRFENNLGGTSLVKQWERCIRLTHEPWVWVFADDDYMDTGCVAAFFQELEQTGGRHDLYRFNTIWANTTRKEYRPSPPHPLEETGQDFLLARLRGGRTSTFQELIFSRAAWEAVGGIPDFPLAWAADDAFIATMGLRRPLRTIAGPRVSWRVSEVNISNDSSKKSFRTKLKASEAFMRWTLDFFAKNPPADKKLSELELRRLIENWLLNHIHEHTWRFLDWQACCEIERLAANVWRRQKGHGFFKALQLNAAHLKRKCLGRLKKRKAGC